MTGEINHAADARKALVIEGGGMRMSFSTGVTDAFLAANFNPFDFYVGVSSGSTTLASYIAGQQGRNINICLDQSCRPEFVRLSRYLRGGDLMDVKWLWDVLERESPLDEGKLFARTRDFYIVMTNAIHGHAVYQQAQADSLIEALRASSSIPFLTRQPVMVNDEPYFDGGVADAIPIRWTLAQSGVERAMLIRTRHEGYVKSGQFSDAVLSRWVKNPGLAQSLKERADRYNQTLAWMDEPENKRKILQIMPPDDPKMANRMCQDEKRLRYSYDVGLEYGREAMRLWNGWNQ